MIGVGLEADQVVAAFVLEGAEFPALDAGLADAEVFREGLLREAETFPGAASFFGKQQAGGAAVGSIDEAAVLRDAIRGDDLKAAVRADEGFAGHFEPNAPDLMGDARRSALHPAFATLRAFQGRLRFPWTAWWRE